MFGETPDKYEAIKETLLRNSNVDHVSGAMALPSMIGSNSGGIDWDGRDPDLRTELPPLAVALTPAENFRFMMIKIKDGLPLKEAAESVEESWKTVMPECPFEYRYLEDEYDDMYQSETRIAILLLFFTVAAIIIASLGLFGLASFLAEKRTRAIGIRKTLGSSELQIINLMISQFSKLVLISIVIAIPLSWYFLDKWLDNYAYKTELSFDLFTLPAICVLIFAIITVFMQAWKASRTSPAVCLKYE